MKKLIPVYLIAILLMACNGSGNNSNNENTSLETTIPIIDFSRINAYPHDITSFTEGFLFNDGKLYESTGATQQLPQTRSLFGIVDLATGKIDTKVEIDKTKYFGEGITILNGKFFQLTYKTKVGFVYDVTSLKKIKEFTYPSQEGWGMTTDGQYLIMSDGTNILTYLDPDSLHVVKTTSVTENGYAKEYLNELEYIKGFIYANVWGTNTIAKINPKDGKVLGNLDLTSLHNEVLNLYPNALEMNGIAYDSITNKVFITGKLWPKIYEIKFSF